MNKEVAMELRRRLQIKGALRFENITKPLGLTVKEVDSDGFDGALVRRSSGIGGRILVKRGIRELGRKRFTTAHECHVDCACVASLRATCYAELPRLRLGSICRDPRQSIALSMQSSSSQIQRNAMSPYEPR